MAAGTSPLFDRVVQASGLSPVFAAAVVRRACTHAGVAPETLSRRDLAIALPTLERAMRIYVPEADVAPRMTAIRKLAGL